MTIISLMFDNLFIYFYFMILRGLVLWYNSTGWESRSGGTHGDESHVRLWTQHYGLWRQLNILDFLGHFCEVMVVVKVLEIQLINPANIGLGVVMAAVPERSCWQAANSAEVSNNNSARWTYLLFSKCLLNGSACLLTLTKQVVAYCVV